MMRIRTLAVAGIVLLALSTAAQAALVKCLGKSCGGSGQVPGFAAPFMQTVFDYLYEVTVNDPSHVHIFQVGTCDGNVNNYSTILHSTNWLLPAGPGVLNKNPFFQEPHRSPMTQHGVVSGALPPPWIPGPPGQAPNSQCPYVVQWMRPSGGTFPPGANTYYFGFNNPNPPHDVGGLLCDWTLQQFIWDEDWQQPVGVGLGPLHGPEIVDGEIPEPVTVALLALGGTVWFRCRRRNPRK